MGDVVVLYHDDSSDWKDYLLLRLKDLLPTDSCPLQSVWPLTEPCQRKLTEAKCMVVIASPLSLQYLIQHPECRFSFLEKQSQRCVLLLLGVSADDVESPEHRIHDHFPHYEQWQKVGHESVEDILKVIVDTVEKAAAAPPSNVKRPPPKAPKPNKKADKKETPTPAPRNPMSPKENKQPPESSVTAQKQTENSPKQTVKSSGSTPNLTVKSSGSTPNLTGKNSGSTPAQKEMKKEPSPAASPRPGKAKKQSFELYPTEIRCETPTTVTISLEESLSDGTKMTVVLTGADNKVIGVCDTTRRNPYTYTFITPVHMEGQVTATVMLLCDDQRSSKTTLGTGPLTYIATTEQIWSLLQVHLGLLHSACEMLSQHRPAGDVDRALSSTMTELMDTLQPRTFEQLFGIYAYSENEECMRKHVTPTLLHLAALYGLQELSMKLMDLPDSASAYSIVNKQHRQPADLASGAGHGDLAGYLQHQQEVNDHVDDIYEVMMGPLYDKCQEDELSYSAPFPVAVEAVDIYLLPDGVRRTASESEVHYLDMAGGGADEEKDEDGPDYEQVDPSPHRRTGVPADPMRVPLEHPPGTETMSRSQLELVDINTQVKNGELSIADAEKLFREWEKQMKATAPQSFIAKQEGLQRMREELRQLNGASGKRGGGKWRKWRMFTKHPKVERNISIRPGETRTFRKPSLTANKSEVIPEDGVAEPQYLAVVGDSSPRNSCNSVASSDRASTASTDSAYETDGVGVDDVIPRRRLPPPFGTSDRNSLREELDKQLSNAGDQEPPPPLPPRLPLPAAGPRAGKGLPNRASKTRRN